MQSSSNIATMSSVGRVERSRFWVVTSCCCNPFISLRRFWCGLSSFESLRCFSCVIMWRFVGQFALVSGHKFDLVRPLGLHDQSEHDGMDWWAYPNDGDGSLTAPLSLEGKTGLARSFTMSHLGPSKSHSPGVILSRTYRASKEANMMVCTVFKDENEYHSSAFGYLLGGMESERWIQGMTFSGRRTINVRKTTDVCELRVLII